MYANIKNILKSLNVSYIKDSIIKILSKIHDKIIPIVYSFIFIVKSEKIKKILFVFYVSKIKVANKSTKEHQYAVNFTNKAGTDPNFRICVDHNVANVLHLNKSTPGLKVQTPPRTK